MQKGVLLFFIIVVLASCVFAQTVIKEKVNINPESATTLSTNDSLDIKRPIYLEHGGNVTLYFGNFLVYGYELWEESLGHLEGGSLPFVDSLNLGTFPQWHKFVFYVYQPSTGKRYYNLSPDEEVFPDSGYAYLELGFWPTFPQDSINIIPELSWDMDLKADLSLARMPPQEVLNLPWILGNPFKPDNSISSPVNGNVYAVIKSANANSNDNLFTDIPKDSLLAANVKNYVGDTLHIGRIAVGDSIRFYIKSSRSIVKGMNLYPANFYQVPFQTGNGEMYLGTLNFEDWTDLYFDDLQLDVYVHPDSINTYYSDVAVNFNQPEISPGDTDRITLMQKNADGTLSPFNSGTTYDVNIFQGQQNGTLYSPQYDDTSDSFIGINGDVLFIAADSVKNDSAQAIIKVIAHPNGGGIAESVRSRLKLNKNKVTLVRAFPSTIKEATGIRNKHKWTEKITGSNNVKKVSVESPGFIGFGVITIKGHTILLGKSKYYQVEQNNNTGGLRIEEIKPDKNGIPQQRTGLDGSWYWLTDNKVWGDNPVKKVSGDKLGVYWETGKPIWNGDKQIGTLAPGLIRIVGRYWKKDTTYEVKLTAEDGPANASVKIKIVKPSKLYSKNYTGASFSHARDIFDKQYNLDSLCIYLGGRYGIPPQLIKGQMVTESEKTTFTLNDGTRVDGLAPSYRYEPFKQFKSGIKTLENNGNPFVVTKTAMGSKVAASVPVIGEHKYVEPYYYQPPPTMVWDILDTNSQLTNVNNPSTYGYRYKGDTPQDARKKGQIYSNLYSEINRLYKQELSDAKVSIMKKYKVKRGHALTDDQQIEANNLAREQLVDYLKDKYKGGLTSIPAQTRISASYGLLQILYETAVNEEDYPHGLSNRPENLNELSGLAYSLKYLLRMFNHNNIEFSSNSNWSTQFTGDTYLKKPISGYEGALQVMVHFWNSGKKTYYNDVFNNMENFLPRR